MHRFFRHLAKRTTRTTRTTIRSAQPSSALSHRTPTLRGSQRGCKYGSLLWMLLRRRGPWGRPRHTGERTSCSWPGSAWLSPRRSWRTALCRRMSGFLCSPCCLCSSVRNKQVEQGWVGGMDDSAGLLTPTKTHLRPLLSAKERFFSRGACCVLIYLLICGNCVGDANLQINGLKWIKWRQKIELKVHNWPWKLLHRKKQIISTQGPITCFATLPTPSWGWG